MHTHTLTHTHSHTYIHAKGAASLVASDEAGRGSRHGGGGEEKTNNKKESATNVLDGPVTHVLTNDADIIACFGSNSQK